MIRGVLDRFEEFAGAMLLVLMCGVGTIQVVSRFISTFTTAVRPIYWGEEACTFFFVWLSFIGASYALKTGDHFAVEIARDKLPARARRAVHLLGLAGVAAFSLLLVFYGAVLAHGVVSVRSPALEWSKSWSYAAVPAGGLLMLVRSVLLFRGVLNERRTDDAQDGVKD